VQRETDAPWIAGTTSVVLSRELAVAEPELVRALVAPLADGRIAKRAGWYASPSHVPRVTPEQRSFFDELVPAQPGDLVPVDFASTGLVVRRSKVPGVQAAFDARLGTGELVRVGEHLYGGSQIAEIRRRLEGTLATEGALTAARFRDLVGSSRKYAVPLLEYFDRIGVTVRDGDQRRLAPKPES
jgi:selenocysteine-specific elongation factor